MMKKILLYLLFISVLVINSGVQAAKKKLSHGVGYTVSAMSSYGFPSQWRSQTNERMFIFSPRLKAWAAYNGQGKLLASGRASGGSHYCPDIKRSCRTLRGIFRVNRKGGVHCRSTRYPLPRGGAPMPYCMFFSKYYAIHGSPDVPNRNVSHGCVRVTPQAAQWLTSHFISIGTKVWITSY